MKIPTHTQVTTTPSPLGPLTLAATERCLVGVWFEDQAHFPDLSGCIQASNDPVLSETSKQLAQYFAGQRTTFELPLDLSTGTAFQNAVWQAMLGLAYGKTCSYKALSDAIGRPTAVRAVAAAVGRNPFSIIVPCHRVLGSNGALTGYAGGLQRKTALLQLESTL
jgi:methylated-DNA-[protein]-cysteine S-methyltransferase